MGRSQEPAEFLKARHSLRDRPTCIRCPYALTQRDESTVDEERWITLGSVGPGAVLFVVHTSFERQGEEAVRIISARAATPRERGWYEETKQGTKTRHRRPHGEERRRH
ncbi:MAG TPA: BrnT family toxin [Candidatus Sulfotelmatobacter sp.]